MSKFKAAYVPLIFLLPWIAWPLAWFFAAIKPAREAFATELSNRNTNRQVYNSSTTYEGRWPSEGRERPEGQADKDQDQQAFEDTRAARQQTLAEETAIANQHRAELQALLNRYMQGLDQDKFDYEKPDILLQELLYKQRDEAGPRFIRFLHKTYPDLYFSFDPNVPPPPINLTATTLPPTGTEGRLPWPIGRGGVSMSVYGPYNKLLEFVETLPDKYDRIAEITALNLTRRAFDYKGNVLMQLDTAINFYVWPKNIAPPAPPPAPEYTGGEGAAAPPAEGGGGGGGGDEE